MKVEQTVSWWKYPWKFQSSSHHISEICDCLKEFSLDSLLKAKGISAITMVCVCVFVTTSQDGDDGYFSYIVYRFIILKGRTSDFSIGQLVCGHKRSKSKNLVNTLSQGKKHGYFS